MKPEVVHELYSAVVAKRPELAVTSRDGLIGECVLRFIALPANEWASACSVCNWWSEQHQRFATEMTDGPPTAENPDGLYETNCEVDLETASDRILAKWVEALPRMAWIGHSGAPHDGWRVCYREPTATTMVDAVAFSPVCGTPLEALAAYWLGATAPPAAEPPTDARGLRP